MECVVSQSFLQNRHVSCVNWASFRLFLIIRLLKLIALAPHRAVTGGTRQPVLGVLRPNLNPFSFAM
jgi:hypothetical protein